MGRTLSSCSDVFLHGCNATVFVCVPPQIENANDVLIMPLERFRKEQISAAKVRTLKCKTTKPVAELSSASRMLCTSIDMCVQENINQQINKNPFSAPAVAMDSPEDTVQI